MRDLQLLQLFQLFDSQFPVGAFAHSGGLETYGQAGAGLAELRDILGAQIRSGWGRADLAAASLAWSAAGGVDSASALPRLASLVTAHKTIPAWPSILRITPSSLGPPVGGWDCRSRA